MKILFFISVLGHGKGGHFHSLNHISNKISNIHEVAIVSIGPGNNSTISDNPNYLSHIAFNGINLLKLRNSINNIVKIFQPDIFHFFDSKSYNAITPLYPRSKIKFVLNKCGGPNPLKLDSYPYAENLVLFSAENKIWFENNIHYKNSNIVLIPNRVSKISTVHTNIHKPKGFFTFVKISRIGHTYKDSILDSITLIDTLYKKNDKLKLKLFIIGTVEDRKILKEISLNKYVIDGTVTILTDSMYTKEAAKMLYLADAVIATGRGLMEATSIGLPALTVNSESDTPVLLNKNTFKDAFLTNFSNRNTFNSLANNENLDNIEKLIVNENYYQEVSLYMKELFDENFDIDKAIYKYDDFYKSIGNNNKLLPINTFSIIDSLYNFYKYSRKIKN